VQRGGTVAALRGWTAGGRIASPGLAAAASAMLPSGQEPAGRMVAMHPAPLLRGPNPCL